MTNIEHCIDEMENMFRSKGSNYFFTEKELHSYFYHICQIKGFDHKGISLIHTEYPTPFKCKPPFEYKSEDNSRQQRAHLDMVLINPSFIDWVMDNIKKNPHEIIYSLKNKNFSIYINEFRKYYTEFVNKYNESILLYALEFKYLRHTYTGEKYSSINVRQDINKLKLLQKETFGKNSISYCSKVRSLVFIGDRIQEKTIDSMESISEENPDICMVTTLKR